MIAVVDSGSTKADWVFIKSNGNQLKMTTRGLNPFLNPPSIIEKMIREDWDSLIDAQDINRVYFYGAGCSDEKRCLQVEEGLGKVFPNAKFTIEHDLLASARALCQSEPGIACILGTGSNSCLYDGLNIVDNIPSLGYLAGDEGSGCYFGKQLLRTYYYREMPEDLAKPFHDDYLRNKQLVWDRMYGSNANVYFASLSRFMTNYVQHPYIVSLISDGFNEFISRHVVKYKDFDLLPIHFVGSVAWHYSSHLSKVLTDRGLHPGQILQKPIDSLVAFHLNQIP